jgi:uncharacterized membrane protein YphA (DoxX/SURF4 family)
MKSQEIVLITGTILDLPPMASFVTVYFITAAIFFTENDESFNPTHKGRFMNKTITVFIFIFILTAFLPGIAIAQIQPANQNYSA